MDMQSKVGNPQTVQELYDYLKNFPADMEVSNEYGEDLEVEVVGNTLELR